MFVSRVCKMLGVYLFATALLLSTCYCRDTSRQVMVISAEDSKKEDGHSKLEDLRAVLNLRQKNKVTKDYSALTEPDLASELSETIGYIDEVEKDHMKFLDTIDEAGLISNLRNQADNGVSELTNRTISKGRLAASDFLLKNQRDRNRKAHSQAHRALVEARRLSQDYIRSSALDSSDRIQNARLESAATRARASADVRDQTLDLRGKRYEKRIRQRTRLRNALQAAKADLRSTVRKTNAAVNYAEREDEIRRRLERIQQAQKAREAYASILTDQKVDELTDY